MSPVFAKGSAPRYAQVAEALPPTDRPRDLEGRRATPLQEALMGEFEVSRVAVRQAVDLLAWDGLVEPRQGRGTFVTGRAPDERWLRVETSLADLAEVYRDTRPELLNLAVATAAPPLLPEDGLPAPSQFFMRWLHARGGRSCCVISIYLDERVFRKAPERFRTETGIPILAAMRKPAVARAGQMLIILFQLPTFWEGC